MELITAAQFAAHKNVPVRTVQHWCKQGRIEGATKLGRDWLIPVTVLETFTPPPMGRPQKLPA